jgi:hypothetical protein
LSGTADDPTHPFLEGRGATTAAAASNRIILAL